MLLPTDEEGTSSPSSAIAVTSTTAMSSLPRKPSHTIGARCDRWMSEYSEVPSLILFRMIGSDWYGVRKATPSTSASAPSSSGAVEAPVHMPMENSSPRSWASLMRAASAPGTSLGYPAPVKPENPTFIPCLISFAASSAVVTLLRKAAFSIRDMGAPRSRWWCDLSNANETFLPACGNR